MPTIPNRFEFEPNRNALRLWLFTRKGEQQYGMTAPPGFYVTTDFGKDQFWFMLAMILEIVGIALLIANGLSLGDSLFATIAIIGALALFAADLFLAYKLHRRHEKICFGRNKLRVTDDSKEIGRIQEEMKKGKAVDIIIIISMVIIAIVKFLGIALLGMFDHVAIFVALILMFGIIVYVHVSHTGYYIYEFLTSRAFKKQKKQFDRGNELFTAKPRREKFWSQEELLGSNEKGEKRSELIGNKHKIVTFQGQKEGNKQAYELQTVGILIDDDISTFLGQGGLDGEQKSVIARVCLKHQLNIHTGEI